MNVEAGRVLAWVVAAFGPVVANDRVERNHRFLEEALELVQALGCTASEAHQLVDYVFSRPTGDAVQELGGTLTTVMALANANQLDLDECFAMELDRCWTNIERIRAKQAAKPKHGPLPGGTI